MKRLLAMKNVLQGFLLAELLEFVSKNGLGEVGGSRISRYRETINTHNKYTTDKAKN